jgi:hypothetical protein
MDLVSLLGNNKKNANKANNKVNNKVNNNNGNNNNNNNNNNGNDNVNKSVVNKSSGNKIIDRLNATNPYRLMAIVFLIIIIIGIAIYFGRKAYKNNRSKINNNPILIDEGKDVYKNHTKLKWKSDIIVAADEGIEFSYSMWIYVADWNLNFGKWKPILVKRDSNNNIAPGLWFYPEKNAIHARISTTANENRTEGCDISDFPLQKWVHLGYVLKNRSVNIYVDGKLARSCNLLGLPKLNTADVKVGGDDSYFGKMSRLQYFNRSLTSYEIESLYDEGRYVVAQSNRFYDRVSAEDAISKATDWLTGSD